MFGHFTFDTPNCCRSGADFLGPLLPAVAEICSDFDPTVDVEPSLLKLFRNLWFYVALFGLAPPIQKSQPIAKSVSTTLNSVGSMGAIPLQAVGGPYMWNELWSSAVKRIAQGTPPLVRRCKFISTIFYFFLVFICCRRFLFFNECAICL